MEAPAGAELRAAARSQGGLRWCAGCLRAQNGRDHGQGAGAEREKAGLPGQKRAGLPGNGAQRARFGLQPGRSAGRKPGKPGGCGAETAASGGVLPGKQRGGGAKTAGFGAVGGKKGRKKPPHGGFRAGSGAWHGILRTACDGFTFFPIPRPGRDSLRAYIGRNRRRSSSDKTAAKTLCFSSGCFFRPSE